MFLDQVHFEVVEYAAAVRLTERLGQTWTAGVLGGEPYVVAAAVSSDPSDLAALLRSVEAWVAEESLYAIRFMLDNEIHVLAARGPDRKAPAFLIPVEEVEETSQAA
ncbi:MAG: hypothetical protein E6G31_02060 [Actinobacteria bacterium]|jgi:hypothetical protein|nr:MAG: hypothetical protein E6G31_02060 [Actinomycetota bacterium]